VLTLSLLGAPSFAPDDPGSAGELLRQPRRLALLALLAVPAPGRWIRRERIILYLWPDRQERHARIALRVALHALRRALGPGAIATRGDELQLAASALRCDVATFESLAPDRPADALELYRGDLLDAFHASAGNEFEEWLSEERARLRRLATDAARRVAQQHESRGDLPAAIQAARRAVALAPFEEPAHRILIGLLARAGDRAGALAAFSTLSEALERDLEAQPSPETQALIARVRRGSLATRSPIEELAILPLRDRTGRADGDELCDAVTAGLASRLARVARLRVKARTVVARYRDATDPLAAGTELGVESVVVGELSAPPGRVELRVEVVRVSDGRLLLGQVFTARSDELFQVESAAASAICRALGSMSDDDVRQLEAIGPSRGDAYVHYVRGQFLFLRAAAGGRPDDIERSRDCFEQALACDPRFAPAIAGLSNYYAVAAARSQLPFAQGFARAIELSREAIALDPGLAIPHVHFGVQAMYLDGDWDLAGREFARAVAVDPGYPEGHRFLAIHHAASGRAAVALEHFQHAVQLEPSMPIYRNGLAAALMGQRRYEEAIEQLRTALALDPRYWAARDRLLRCLERLGRFEEAVAERQRDDRASGKAFAEALESGGLEGYRRQRGEELRATMRETGERVAGLREPRAQDLFNPPELQLALGHAELGEWEAARAWRERACRDRPWQIRWFTSNADLLEPSD
jgi:DNA-binding SARP family transcriptional activator/tetratricopeptide (TPR) repeat protein